MPEKVDCVVIGAGVVGLACARALARTGREVMILESQAGFGTGASSRNSEVIHAGLYYPPGSLKARLCVAGKLALYNYCETHGVAHQRCGKLIVATSLDQRDRLAAIQRAAQASGVFDVRMIGPDEAREMEPALSCVAALHSPSTGIVDSHGLMLAYLGEAEQEGALLVLKTPVRCGQVMKEGILLETGGEAPMSLLASTVVNAAGLFAPTLAAQIKGLSPQHVPKAWYAKGNYFSLTGKTPFSRLIYPVPEPGGLGVHLTIDLQGRARFGPDVEWLDDEAGTIIQTGEEDPFDYQVTVERMPRFEEAIRLYWPDLPTQALTPDYAGIRAKIVGPNAPAADFRIDGAAVHGVTGLVNLFGIESPGLTASLSIADQVKTLLTR